MQTHTSLPAKQPTSLTHTQTQMSDETSSDRSKDFLNCDCKLSYCRSLALTSSSDVTLPSNSLTPATRLVAMSTADISMTSSVGNRRLTTHTHAHTSAHTHAHALFKNQFHFLLFIITVICILCKINTTCVNVNAQICLATIRKSHPPSWHTYTVNNLHTIPTLCC